MVIYSDHHWHLFQPLVMYLQSILQAGAPIASRLLVCKIGGGPRLEVKNGRKGQFRRINEHNSNEKSH